MRDSARGPIQRTVSLAAVLSIALLCGGVAGTRVRVPGWVPVLALVAGLAAFLLGFVLGYEDDTRGGGSGFQVGVVVGWTLIVIATAAMAAFMVRAVRLREMQRR